MPLDRHGQGRAIELDGFVLVAVPALLGNTRGEFNGHKLVLDFVEAERREHEAA